MTQPFEQHGQRVGRVERARTGCAAPTRTKPGGMAGGKLLPLGNKKTAAIVRSAMERWLDSLNRDGEERRGGDP